ncbi:hypothetical protein L9F63_016482, partial [Diploptera punctata]
YFTVTMKWIAVVLMCSIVDLASVNCKCDLGTGIDYDPKQVEGDWYVDYSSPSIFEQMSKIRIKFKLEDQTYNSTLTITFKNETTPREFDSTWEINDNKDLQVKVPELSTFNGVYRLIAAEDKQYIIFRGCQDSSNGEPLIFIETAEQCPDEDMLKKAVENMDPPMDCSDFTKDPEVHC